MLKIPPHITQVLKLNEKDIAVYVDLLQFGSSAVSTIAARTSIDRTTTYAVLKRLMKRGVVVRTSQKDTTHFIALAPEVFEDKIKQDIEKKEMELGFIREFLPQLNRLQSEKTNRPVIQIFEGPNGIITLYELLLKKSKKQDAFLTIEKMPAKLVTYLKQDYIKHKLKREVFSRVLVQDSKRARHYQSLDQKSNRETKLISKHDFPFETEIVICEDDEIAIIDFQKELIGVLLKSKSIKNTLASIFDLIWKAY